MKENSTFDKFLFLWDVEKQVRLCCRCPIKVEVTILCVIAFVSYIPAFFTFTDYNFGEISIAMFNALCLLSFAIEILAIIKSSITLSKLGYILITCLTYIYIFAGFILTFFMTYMFIPKSIVKARAANGNIGDVFRDGPINDNVLYTIVALAWLSGAAFGLYIDNIIYLYYQQLDGKLSSEGGKVGIQLNQSINLIY